MDKVYFMGNAKTIQTNIYRRTAAKQPALFPELYQANQAELRMNTKLPAVSLLEFHHVTSFNLTLT